MAWTTIALIAVLLLVPVSVRAEYVLPYPSYMPGNKLYRVSRLFDRMKQPFYFGNISTYKYHLSLADKYLVEAKTLFEYKQYLLAADALERSDAEFRMVPISIKRAKAEEKDMKNFDTQIIEAAATHQTVLRQLRDELPVQVTWAPEKVSPIVIPVRSLIDASIALRTIR